MLRKIIIIWAATCLIACSPRITPLTPSIETKEHLVGKNYEINVKQQVYVGQPIVKVRDYYLIETRTDYVAATNDFKVSSAVLEASGKKGKKLPIIGEVIWDKKRHLSVILQNRPCLRMMVDENGVMSSTLFTEPMNCGNMLLVPFEIVPDSTRFNVVPAFKSQVQFL